MESYQGRLRTTVHHTPAAEPGIIPSQSDHPRHMHRNVIKGVLSRAARLCSDGTGFDEGRLIIELMLLSIWLSGEIRFLPCQAILRREQCSLGRIASEIEPKPTRREKEQEEKIHGQQQRPEYNKKKIQVHCTCASGPKLESKNDLCRLCRKHYLYPGPSMNNVTVKIGTQSCRFLHQSLVKNKPPRSTLVADPPATISKTG